jgi:hypothetical protein
MPFNAGAVVGTIELKYDGAIKALTAVQQQTQRTMAQMSAAFAKAGSYISKNEASLRSIGMGMTAAGGAIAGLGIAAYQAGAKTADLAESLDNMTKSTGLSREYLQELKFVADQMGFSFEAVAAASPKLQRALMGVELGTGNVGKILKEMGIEIHNADGSLKSMTGIFPAVVAGLQSMENATQRNMYASQIFGRGFAEIAPLLAMSRVEMERYAKTARELGIVWSNDMYQAALKLDSQLDVMKAQFAGVGATILQSLVPALNGAIPLLTDLIKKAGEVTKATAAWAEVHPGLAKGLLVVAGAVGALMLALGPLLMVLPGIVTSFGLLAAAGISVTAVLTGAAGIVAGIIALTAAIWGAKKAWDAYVGVEVAVSEEQTEINRKVGEAYAVVETLGKKTNLTKEESAKLHKAMQDLALIYPDVVKSYDAQGNAVMDLAKLMEKARKAHEDYIHTLAYEANIQKHKATIDRVTASQAVADQRALIASTKEAQANGKWGTSQQKQFTKLFAEQNAELRKRIALEKSLRAIEDTDIPKPTAAGATKPSGAGGGGGSGGGGGASSAAAAAKVTGDAMLEASQKALTLIDTQIKLAEASGDTSQAAQLQATYVEMLTRVYERWKDSTDQARLSLAKTSKEMLNDLAAGGENWEALANAQFDANARAESLSIYLENEAKIMEAWGAIGGFLKQKATDLWAAITAPEVETRLTAMRQRVEELTTELENLPQGSQAAADAMAELAQTWEDLRVAMSDPVIVTWQQQLADQIAEIWTQTWQSVERAFADAIKGMMTGTTNLADFMRAIWDLVLTAISQIIAAAVVRWINEIAKVKKAMSEIGGGGGGFFGSLLSGLGSGLGGMLGLGLGKLLFLQHGGIVTKPTLAMVGEAGPEAVIPLSQAGGMGGGAFQFGPVNLSVGSLDELSLQRLMRRSMGAFGKEMWRRGLRGNG